MVARARTEFHSNGKNSASKQQRGGVGHAEKAQRNDDEESHMKATVSQKQRQVVEPEIVKQREQKVSAQEAKPQVWS